MLLLLLIGGDSHFVPPVFPPTEFGAVAVSARDEPTATGLFAGAVMVAPSELDDGY